MTLSPGTNSAPPDLGADPTTRRVLKRPIPVGVVFAPTGGVIDTLEGPVRYEPGDAILTGVQGERWPVRRELFDTAYDPIPPSRTDQDGAYRKRPAVALALQLKAALTVPAGRQGDPLQGRPGDWLLQYEDGSLGIVSDSIFLATYTYL